MEYKCDICGESENKVGTLITGRMRNGADWQVCKPCIEIMGIRLTAHNVAEYQERTDNNG